MEHNFSMNFKVRDGASLAVEKKGLDGKQSVSKGIRKVQQHNGAVTISGNTENDEEKTDNMDKVILLWRTLYHTYSESPGGQKKWIIYKKKEGSLILKCYRKLLDLEKEFKTPNWPC